MLQKAREKDPNGTVEWLPAAAAATDLPSGTYCVVFNSHLLHHVQSPLAVLRECQRVLAPSGVVLIRYGAVEQIRDDVEHPLFPEVREMDEARTSSVAQTEEWLGLAGFREVFSREVVQQTYPDGPAHLEAARNKSTSVLTLVSEESYQTGLRRLEECVRRQPDNEWLLFSRMTLTVGRT